MWNLDDLNFLAPHSIDNSVGTFDYFSVLRTAITPGHSSGVWERRKLITSPEYLIDNLVGAADHYPK